MVTLILALCVPVTAFVAGFFTLKGVRLGMGLEQPTTVYKEEPPKEENNPIANKEVFNEWVHGGE